MDNENIAPVETQNAPVIADAPVSVPPGFLHKDEVTRIVNDRTSDAYNKGLARGQASVKVEDAPVSPAQAAPVATISPEAIREMVIKTQQELRHQEEEAVQNTKIQATVDVFVDRIQEAGLTEAVTYLGIGNTPESNALLIGMAAFDNTADILRVLREDPDKYDRLCDVYRRSPQRFADEITKLSNSIKKHSPSNHQQNMPREPLSQFKSSVSSMGSGNDVHTADASDLRGDPRYRC